MESMYMYMSINFLELMEIKQDQTFDIIRSRNYFSKDKYLKKFNDPSTEATLETQRD